jgi:hypothetical protein
MIAMKDEDKLPKTSNKIRSIVVEEKTCNSSEGNK